MTSRHFPGQKLDDIVLVLRWSWGSAWQDERDSDGRGYFTNQLTGESKVSYLPADCEGNSAWELRWGQGGNGSADGRVGVSANGRESER